MRYIGSKVSLLDEIKTIIDENVTDAKSFCDIFSGTSSVARYFKQWYEIYSNDLLFFSYCLQMATIENDCVPKFNLLKDSIGYNNPVDFLNSVSEFEMEKLPKEKRFFQNNYSPIGGRMYLTDSNALKIDFARNKIEDWKSQGLIDELEYYYLVACVVEGIPFISNISGTYGAYNKKWDKRSYKTFELLDLPVNSNSKNNKCFNEDGVDLLKKIKGDILYIDPPYNSRQYPPNYHVLETAAKYDFPDLRGLTGQRDYAKQKSQFCSKSKAIHAFEELLSVASFKHIILSYSTEGIMDINEIENIMKSYGKSETFKIKKISYRRFKSRETKGSDSLKELLFYIEK